jgi:hypothetical protein
VRALLFDFVRQSDSPSAINAVEARYDILPVVDKIAREGVQPFEPLPRYGFRTVEVLLVHRACDPALKRAICVVLGGEPVNFGEHVQKSGAEFHINFKWFVAQPYEPAAGSKIS